MARYEDIVLKYLRDGVLPTAFCPGCGCGIVLSSYIRAIDELNIAPEKIVSISGIGCSSWIPSPYFKSDTLHTTHGRGIAFATGVKLMMPHMYVIVIAGDGDIVAIGGNHLIHAARRNIDITVFMVNNMIYGMTGGQVGPTTPAGIKTTTTPYGNVEPPFDTVNLVVAAGASYAARWTVYHHYELKESMKAAIQKKGFSFVEIIAQCVEYYGRKIGLPDAKEMLKMFKKQSIPVEKAADMSSLELKDKIVVGVFADRDLPEFTERMKALNKSVMQSNKIVKK
jgi:2-oxoglutarate ferredoxin oxidoreductase subunit beta